MGIILQKLTVAELSNKFTFFMFFCALNCNIIIEYKITNVHFLNK